MYMKDQCHNQLLLTATQLRTQHLWDTGGGKVQYDQHY